MGFPSSLPFCFELTNRQVTPQRSRTGHNADRLCTVSRPHGLDFTDDTPTTGPSETRGGWLHESHARHNARARLPSQPIRVVPWPSCSSLEPFHRSAASSRCLPSSQVRHGWRRMCGTWLDVEASRPKCRQWFWSYLDIGCVGWCLPTYRGDMATPRFSPSDTQHTMHGRPHVAEM